MGLPGVGGREKEYGEFGTDARDPFLVQVDRGEDFCYHRGGALAMNDFNSNPKSYDPRMHSAEHILNQTMVRIFQCGRSVNAHIEKKKSKCDYWIDRSLSPEEVSEIAERVNAVISRDLPVTSRFITREEAARTFNLTKLPEDAGEMIRIVEIGDYDACPCSGEHVPSTRSIGRFVIASAEPLNGLLRIRFKLQDD
jgi:misacylated tRNA(Ala) deacylase